MAAVSVELIDIGANLAGPEFTHDLPHVLERAATAGIHTLLITGSSVLSSEGAIKLAHAHPERLFATVGLHPHHARDWQNDTYAQLRTLAAMPGVRAIGETGLDFNRNFSTEEQQLHAFEQQLALAEETGLPLFLHERDAFSAMHARLHSRKNTLGEGVVHCFTGSSEALFAYLDLGLHIGITGWVCDERRGTDLQALVPLIPLDRLLIETDAPYLLPRTIQPKPKSRRNEPAYLPWVLHQVASLYGLPEADIAAHTTANARRLFALQ